MTFVLERKWASCRTSNRKTEQTEHRDYSLSHSLSGLLIPEWIRISIGDVSSSDRATYVRSTNGTILLRIRLGRWILLLYYSVFLCLVFRFIHSFIHSRPRSLHQPKRAQNTTIQPEGRSGRDCLRSTFCWFLRVRYGTSLHIAFKWKARPPPNSQSLEFVASLSEPIVAVL